MKKVLLSIGLALVLGSAVLVGGASADQHEGSWTGEVIDLSCYVTQGAKGPDHGDCARVCIKGGQPMGLLTDDGTLVLLAADPKDEEPYDALKDLAGQSAVVSGKLAERDEMKVITVSASKAAG